MKKAVHARRACFLAALLALTAISIALIGSTASAETLDAARRRAFGSDSLSYRRVQDPPIAGCHKQTARLPESDAISDGLAPATDHLLSLRLTDMAGQPLPDARNDLLVIPLDAASPRTYRLRWSEATERHEGRLPADLYALRTGSLPPNSYPATVLFDLRDADQSMDLRLSPTPLDPTTYDPPVAAKISVGPLNSLGEAEVQGAAGAVLPVAHVLLTNLDSLHLAHTISRPDGSFVANLYAPPGSALLIQHGPHQWLWPSASTLPGNAAGVHPLYPGTILHAPLQPSSLPLREGELAELAGDTKRIEDEEGLSFAAAGAVEYVPWNRLEISPGSHIGSAWAMTGTLQLNVSGATSAPIDRTAPGAGFEVTGTLRISSPAIVADGLQADPRGTAATPVSDISILGDMALVMLYNADGLPLTPHDPVLTSHLAPTGLPIRSAAVNRLALPGGFQVTDLQATGDHCIEGRFLARGAIPLDAPPGIYRPVIKLTFAGVPSSGEAWPAPMDIVSTRPFALDEAALPPITVVIDGKPAEASHRLIWRLLMDNISQGQHGVAAREDAMAFGLSTFIVTQGAPTILPRLDARTSAPIVYRLEPFLPMISADISPGYSPPSPPLIPFALPGGQLRVSIQQPDGSVRDLGSEPFAQAFVRSQITAGGYNLNPETVHLHDVYSLKAATDRFRTAFEQDGHYVITMTGELEDIWGNRYTGGGTYDVWIATTLTLSPGVLPGTPFDVGDTLNPTLQLSPAAPADVTWIITQYPDSDPSQATKQTIQGRANAFGYFNNGGVMFKAPGEYRVDVTASYRDKHGALAMGAMSWGGIVMTPARDATLAAHGRRGASNLEYIPSPWFVLCRDLFLPLGTITRAFPPYYAGDVAWSRPDFSHSCPTESLLAAATIQDTAGALEATIRARADRMKLTLAPPGDLDERFAQGELPLFSSTHSGRPLQMAVGDADQLAYAYFSAQRPGVRVREEVIEEDAFASYWHFDTLYDDQAGVGMLGDQPNDYKFQYIGAVHRDLASGRNEYVGQATGWVHLPDDDPVGSRVMPPFAGPGNGGWTTEGGPLLRLKGQDVDIFILPTGSQPGATLRTYDTFSFAGHIMPPLQSRVAVIVTSPSGEQHIGGGLANRIGYYYNPQDDFRVTEPGLWSVDVRVWHTGNCSAGTTMPPYPTGDVLGSDLGRYWFYVAPAGAALLDISTPAPGFVALEQGITPIVITGTLPAGLAETVVDYTITMPGFILEHGQAAVSGAAYQVVFDPARLWQDHPNLDLIGRDDPQRAGLADTFRIGLLLHGKGADDAAVYQANSLALVNQQITHAAETPVRKTYLPLIRS